MEGALRQQRVGIEAEPSAGLRARGVPAAKRTRRQLPRIRIQTTDRRNGAARAEQPKT